MMQKQRGFTILELMIATAIFSLVLMLSLAGIVQITKMYYQGVTLIRTQEIARSVIEEIGESIRFSKEAVTIHDDYVCVGAKRYTYVVDKQLRTVVADSNDQTKHVLWVDQPSTGCNNAADLNIDTPSGNGREMLAENMRLTRFKVTKDSSLDDVYTVSIGVVYGDSDLLFNEDPVTCKSSFAGAEFCGVSYLSVTVSKRL